VDLGGKSDVDLVEQRNCYAEEVLGAKVMFEMLIEYRLAYLLQYTALEWMIASLAIETLEAYRWVVPYVNDQPQNWVVLAAAQDWNVSPSVFADKGA
jgi:hypothetical protein